MVFFPIPIGSVKGLRVIPNYFASVKRKPCARSDRLLAEVYGGDKRGPDTRRSFAVFRIGLAWLYAIVKAGAVSRWFSSWRKWRFRMASGTRESCPDSVRHFDPAMFFCCIVGFRTSIKLDRRRGILIYKMNKKFIVVPSVRYICLLTRGTSISAEMERDWFPLDLPARLATAIFLN